MTGRTPALLTAAALIAAALVAWTPTTAHADPGTSDAVAEQASRTVLVTLDQAQTDPSQTAETAVAKVADQLADAGVESVTAISPTTVAVTLDQNVTAAEQGRIAAKVEALPGVGAAEPEQVFKAATGLVTSDTYSSSQWAMVGTYGVKGAYAWPYSNGAGVTVAVIDTGVATHPDLAGQFVAGYDFITSSSSSNDGDGWDSDPSDAGDFCMRGPVVASESTWHGTHVSGIVGAIANNGVGIAGVAPGVKLEAVRVLGCGGGTTSDIIAGMRWAGGLTVPGVADNPNPAKVLNMSLGGINTCSSAMQQAIDDLNAKGVLVVVAAMNDGVALSEGAPANCSGSNLVRVVNSTSTGTRYATSNYGTSDMPATISAPGTSILSTLNAGTTTPGLPSYGNMTGTSMSTPYVAGIAAEVMAADPVLTPAQVVATLRANVTAMTGTCSTDACGPGIANAQAAVKSASQQYAAYQASITPYVSVVPVTSTVDGSMATLRVTVANGGSPTLTSVSLSDTLGLTWTCNATSLAALNQTTCTATVQLTQAMIDAGTVSDKLTVVGTTADSKTAAASTTVTATLTQTAALDLTATGTSASKVGDAIIYSLTATNSGSVSISGLSVTNATCDSSNLAAGASTSCAASHTVTQADVDVGSVVQQFSATGSTSAGSVTKDATVTTTLARTASLDLTASGSSVSKVGDVIAYSLTAKNTGNTTVSGLSVTNATCAASTLAPAASTTCIGTSHPVTQADVDAGGVVQGFTATGTAPTGTLTQSASVNTPITRSSGLTIAGSASGSVGKVGDVASFTVSAQNTGNVTLSSLGASGSRSGQMTCGKATLAPGASTSCVGTVVAHQADFPAGLVSDQETVTAHDPSGATVSRTITAATGKLTQAPYLVVSGSFATGQTVTATVGGAGKAWGYKWLLDGREQKHNTSKKPSYLLTGAVDYGHRISVQVLVKLTGGGTVTLTSDPVKVAPGPITLAKPKIAGAAKVGSTLNASTTAAPKTSSVTWRWYRDGKAKGATYAKYKLTKSDKGRDVTVKATAKFIGYTTVTAASEEVSIG